MKPYKNQKSIMEEVLGQLCLKLSNKNLISSEIARIIKDTFNIFKDEGFIEVPIINNKLRNLGWQDQLIDEHILNLLIFVYENGGEKSLKW